MNLKDFSPENYIWDLLRKSDKKTVMYGMGNGADKILAVCRKYGIEVHDFFASDGFVRGHSFHGKRVLTFSEIKQKYGAENINVLLSFASNIPSVLEIFRETASECSFFAPDVPVCGDEIFTLDFARSNSENLKKAYTLLADEESRKIFENVIFYKLTGKIDLLFNAESDKNTVFNSLLDAKNIKIYADIGAYNGDTVRELSAYSPLLSHVIAFEPDRRSFRKLCEYCGTLSTPVIEKINCAAWNCEATLTFGDEGNRNSGIFAKGKAAEVSAKTIDSVLDGRSVDYIKYDVEGCEKEALEGSRQTILHCKPKLLISAYHKSEDVFALPLQIAAMRSDYKIYLRRFPYIPAWDLNLLCI